MFDSIVVSKVLHALVACGGHVSREHKSRINTMFRKDSGGIYLKRSIIFTIYLQVLRTAMISLDVTVYNTFI